MPQTKTKKTSAKPKVLPKHTEPRVRPVTKHRSFKVTQKTTIQKKPLPSIRMLFAQPLSIIKSNTRLFVGLVTVYALLLLVLVKGFGSSFTIVETKQQLNEYLGSEQNPLQTAYALFGNLISSSNSDIGGSASAYQFFISLVVILATIWIARQLLAGEKPRLKDGFYKGMYPLVPFLLVVVIIIVQILPAAIGNFLLSTVLNQGLAATAVEKYLWFLVFGIGMILSLYMVLSSIFALNIVTLPNVSPMQALRSARELVLHRRLGILARIIVAPLAGLVIAAIVFIPLIIWVPVIAEPIFLAATSFGLIFMTLYMYNFYRNLL